MWLFTRYGFFSVACASKPNGLLEPDTLMIRARARLHLKRLRDRFPVIAHSEILSLDNRDYPYRLVIPKEIWIAVVAELTSEQTWSNFKRETETFQGPNDYTDALYKVWSVMVDFQIREQRSSSQRA
jgi:hypothetical protein